jgi:uncharacterized protein (DUF934 family)
MPLVKKTSHQDSELELCESWLRLNDEDRVPETGPVLVPLSRWLADRETLRQRPEPIGVWLASSTDMALELWQDTLESDLFFLPVVAVDFPAFGDGRGYSVAALLRQRHNFKGELRALGDVLADQIPAMVRVGFDAFDVAEGADLAVIKENLSRHTVVYQGATDGRRTVWQLRTAHAEKVAL